MKRALIVLATAALVAGALGTAMAGGPFSFNTADPPVPVPDNTGTLSVCQSILVAGIPTNIVTMGSVVVTMNHTWVGDLSIQLNPPSGTPLTVLNRPGRFQSGSGESDDLSLATPITYDDNAASGISAESMGAGCTGVIGAGCGPNNYIPAPNAGDTPIPGMGTNLAQFVGTDPNGTWTLCVGDSAGGDTGTLSTWTLNITDVDPVVLQGFEVE